MTWYTLKIVPCFLFKAVVLYEMEIRLERRKIANKGKILNQSLSFKQTRRVCRIVLVITQQFIGEY